MILIHQRHRQTDGRTDGRTDDMQSQYRTLHYSASRGKNEDSRFLVGLQLLEKDGAGTRQMSSVA